MENVELQNENSSLSVLLLGNNPIELSTIQEKLRSSKSANMIADVYFDIKSAFKKILDAEPNSIVIDSSYDKDELNRLIKRINTNQKTAQIPITLLKNENRELALSGVNEYVLKQNLSAENLERAIRNSFRMKNTSRYLQLYYRKNKRRVVNYFRNKMMAAL